MLDNSDNPFLITHTAEDEDVVAPPVPQSSADEEEKGDVAGLIPLCVRHANGPQMNNNVFGYDIGQMQNRPWSEPGANLRDYFNYGFNETSWRLYCAMQAEGEASLLSRANAFLSQLNGAARPGAGEETVDAYYAQPQGSSHPYYNAPREGYAKTRPCQRFAEGTCTKGNQCNYSHSYGEVRYHHHHHHQPHQHHHHHMQHQQHHQLHQSYALPPYRGDQGVLPSMGAPPVGVMETFQGGEYRGMPKRPRSPVEREN